MEWTAIPVWLDKLLPLKYKAAQDWCDRNILSQNITFEADLVPALCMALKVSERDLRVCVQDEFLNKKSFAHMTVQRWSESGLLSEAQLLTKYTTLGGKVDELFVWLAIIASQLHLNLVNDSGIWTTRASENPDLRDTLVVIIEHHFLAAATENKQLSEMAIKDGFNNPDDTRVRFTCCPFVLQNLVRDVTSR